MLEFQLIVSRLDLQILYRTFLRNDQKHLLKEEGW
jgi:hypothetical protein